MQRGTQLTVVEAGFDRVPLARRAAAFRESAQVWAQQIRTVERYSRSRHR